MQKNVLMLLRDVMRDRIHQCKRKDGEAGDVLKRANNANANPKQCQHGEPREPEKVTRESTQKQTGEPNVRGKKGINGNSKLHEHIKCVFAFKSHRFRSAATRAARFAPAARCMKSIASRAIAMFRRELSPIGRHSSQWPASQCARWHSSEQYSTAPQRHHMLASEAEPHRAQQVNAALERRPCSQCALCSGQWVAWQAGPQYSTRWHGQEQSPPLLPATAPAGDSTASGPTLSQ